MRSRSRLLLVALVALAAVGLLATLLLGDRTSAQQRAPETPHLRPAVNFAVSAPVSELPPAAAPDTPADESRVIDREREEDEEEGEKVERREPNPLAVSADPAIQASQPEPRALAAPTVSFEGLSFRDNVRLFGGSFVPPDTVGDVGPNHYLQMVNVAFRIWDKQGNPLTPARKLSDLFAPLGPPCGTDNSGDPVVLYDPLADRWILTQFCIPPGSPADNTPMHQAVAVSQTGDPTGAYYLYDFTLPGNKFQDYPKIAVWHDAYYMTGVQFQGNNIAQTSVFAFDRAKMLRGDQAAGYIYFDLALNDPPLGENMLPADIDGLRPPPGTPGLFAGFDADEYGAPRDALRLFDFRADFVNPANSAFMERAESPITVAPFDPRDPDYFSFTRHDIEQPPPATPPTCTTPGCYYLQALQDRIMHRLAYRNFGTHESLVLNHTVNVSGVAPRTPATHQAGIRYYEVRRAPGGPFAVKEQATFAPDSDNRWMGSIAMDGAGNIALGYSVSSLTTFPSIRYAARLSTDPPNGLRQGEARIIDGTGTQRSSSGRWGDYSAMSVDPADDTTFWYTQEYYTAEGSAASTVGWQTRIAAFKLPGATATATGAIAGRVTDCASGLPVANALVEIAGGFTRATLANGTFSASLLPGTYTVTVSAPGRPAAPAQTVTVTAGGTASADFCLNAVSVIVAGRTGFNGESCVPTDTVINPGERLSVTVALPNNGAAATGNLVATLLPTGGVVAPSDPQSYGSIAPGSSAARTFSFTVGAQCGNAVNLTFQLRDGTQDLGTVTIPFASNSLNEFYTENFDNVTAPNLPPGWRSVLALGTPGVAAWRTVGSAVDTPPNAANSIAPNANADVRLESPAITLPAAPAQLSFRLRFDLIEFYQNAVLEVAVGDGLFTDILNSGSTFVAGGYNSSPGNASGHPLRNRLTWSGDSSGHFTVRVNLSPGLAGQAVRLRWRLVTLASSSSAEKPGVFVDSLSLTTGVPFTVGAPRVTFIENFDFPAAPNFRNGWEAVNALGRSTDLPWRTVTGVADTPPQSAYAVGAPVITDKRLTSPPIPIETAGAQLTFRQVYNLEPTFDGAVLEISVAGGPFLDILAAGGSFVSGGYTGRILDTDSPILNRRAWTGVSGPIGPASSFITTRVNLPASAAGKIIRLRWRVGTDTGVQSFGQIIDSVVITDGASCADSCAAVRLVERATLARDTTTGEVVATIAVSNEGTSTATGVRLISAMIGSVSGTPLPLDVGSVPPGGPVTVTVRFPASVGAAGTATRLRLGGTADGGSAFGSATRVTLP